MPVWLSEDDYQTLVAVCERLVPGSTTTGAANYIDGLLGAFSSSPPLIWARGPTSGRHGGEPAFGSFHPLSPLDELAWRIRIEGSAGLTEREFNGPVVGWQERYLDGLHRLGADFCRCPEEEQDRRLGADDSFVTLVFEHCCEGMYGAPEYGGNRDLVGWDAIGFTGDVQPRGWSDGEVTGP